MPNFDEINLAESAPSSLTIDERLKSTLVALGMEYQDIYEMCDYLHLIANIDKLPEVVVDLLAWQWHVDFWESSLPLATKRLLVRNSIPWHRKKGTPGAVEEMIGTVIGNARVTEWYEYGGDPYFFRIETTDQIQDGRTYSRIIALVNATKNVRSWLEKIIVHSDQFMGLYWGGGMFESGEMTVYPAGFEDKTVKMSAVFGGATYLRDQLTVYPKEGNHG